MKKSTLYELTLTCVCLLCFILSNFVKLPLVTTILSFFLFFLVSILVKYLISRESSLSDLISVTAERKRIRLVFITMINLTLVLVSIEPYILSKYKLYTPAFYWLNNNIGYAAIVVFAFSFMLLPTYKVLKFNGRVDKYINHLKTKEILSNKFELKLFTLHRKITALFAKWLRKYHIPIALFGIVFVLYHTYLALINGFKNSYTYLSGYAALFDLLLLSVLGLLRFKRLDKNAHKNLTYVLILLLVLHIIFSELRL